ncbi:MAG: RNA methyltransferase [Eubacteriales bacterium]|nr:RNA methyltransferase [Eubacteriales bacterium]
MANITEITDFTAPELDVYARLSEAELLHLYEPERGVFIAESPKVIERALAAGYEPISLLTEQKRLEKEALPLLERCPGLPVYTAQLSVLTQLTGYQLTRGLLCAMYRKTLPSVEEVCAGARRIAVLEDVVNPTNVGAIFRSAAALHMDAVLLTRGCSDPLYRRAIRVSMGTVFQIPWTFLPREKTRADEGKGAEAESAERQGSLAEERTEQPDAGDQTEGSGRLSDMDGRRGASLEMLRRLGFKTAAMALREDCVPVDDPELLGEEKLAIVLGTEGDGLADGTIADCDYTVRIPMAHGVDSLNVAAASAVAFWELGRR